MKRTFAKFFRFLIILFFVSFSAFLYAEERTVWKYSFDKAGPDNNLEIKGGSLHGPLPEGVSQNFLGWQTSSLKSERLKEEGKTFFRFTADRIFGGSPQLTVRVPELEPSKYYRLTATVRNRSDGGFALYLRENPVPYASIGPALSLEFSDEWQTESVFLQFRKPASNKYSLFFAFSGSGTFDLQEFSIIETDRESYLAQERGMSKKNAMIVNRPDPKWRNYINASCFPFGVPAGWNCRRGSAVLSDDRSGPSGQNAILVKPDFGEIETPQIFSAPFQVPDPNKTYTVSFSCKGSAPIACNGKMFNPAGNWRRFDFPIRIPQGEAGAFLDFSSSKTFLLDGIRIAEEGEKKYCRAGSAEIALGLSASDASEARIQFQDEPSKIRYRILGEWEGITLAVSITNIRNETHEISLVPDSSDGEIDYGVFPQTPFGQFRINVQAMKNGKEISPVAEYVITRLNRPVFWGKDAPDSFFGVHAEPISNILKALKAGGLNWVRLHDAGGQYSLWSSIEPEKGTWKFFDPELKNYRNHDLMIYGQLGGSPVWANYYGKGGPKTPSSYFIRFCAPTDDHLPDFENYAYQMVKHYKGMIQDWCLWNEPWGSFFHKGYDPAHDEYICFDNQGAAYAKVLKAAYKGAKRADPSVRISGFGTTSSADRFTAQIVEAGGFEYCDEIDYHQYAPRYFGFPGDGMKKGLDQTFAPIVKKYGSIGKNIIMSEGSSLTTGSNKGKPLYGIYKYVLPWKNTENYHDAGDRIVRFLLAYHVSGVKRVFLYTTHGHRNLTRCSFQLLLAGDGYPHPSLAALSAFAQNTEGSRFIEYRKLSPEVYAAVFEKSNGSSFAVITGKKTGRGTVHCSNPGAQAADLYGNPLSFPLKYMGYLQYITAPCPPDKLTFNP